MQDGKSASLTAPNGRMQEKLIRAALREVEDFVVLSRKKDVCSMTSVPKIEWTVDALKMPLNTNTFLAAVARGILDVLQWLRAQDPPCPWDDENVCIYAAEKVI